MWLRSEHVSRRLRGRLNINTASRTKISHHRLQVSSFRKLPSVSNNNHRIDIPNKCSRLTRWRRRCTHFLKEVSNKFLFKLSTYMCLTCIRFCLATIEDIAVHL